MDNISSNQYHSYISQLRKIINSWNLIPGCASDEFDTLANKLLNHLYKGADHIKIQNIIASDLVVIYGFYTHEVDLKHFAKEIMDWWLHQ